MKRLFDANRSPTLVVHLQQDYPQSAHARDVGLEAGSDAQIWEYARAHAFVIVSKDTDVRERSFVEGFPPKIIWLDVGNAGTVQIVTLLQQEHGRVESFGGAADTSLLILSLGASAL